MPRGDPFTRFCQQIARSGSAVAADLHMHSTRSDGEYTPSHVVALAAAAKLRAIALTDHDTFAGLAEARDAALQFPAARRPEVVAGVEVSAEFEGREVHILGLFVDPAHEPLRSAVARIAASRLVRFRAFVEHFHRDGMTLDEGRVDAALAGTACPGRPHLAQLLIDGGFAGSRQEAFQRFLIPAKPALPTKALIPAEDAIRLIHGSGGIASLAHPSSHYDLEVFRRFHALGLRAVEAEHPSAAAGRSLDLRAWAEALGWAVSGGSDCHGGGNPGRAIGARGLTVRELEELRGCAG